MNANIFILVFFCILGVCYSISSYLKKSKENKAIKWDWIQFGKTAGIGIVLGIFAYKRTSGVLPADLSAIQVLFDNIGDNGDLGFWFFLINNLFDKLLFVFKK